MSIASSWEAETRELLSRISKEIKEVRDNAERRIAELQEKAWALEQAIDTYLEMKGFTPEQEIQSLTQRDVEGKTIKEILRLIAQRNSGQLIARHAVKQMKGVDVFSNPDHADSIVYTVLKRSFPEFIKIGKGIYKLNGVQKGITSSAKENNKPSELKQAIQQLKSQFPQITKEGVKDILIERGFDFQGKKPGNSIHMAWVNMGYDKKDKQPEFPGME